MRYKSRGGWLWLTAVFGSIASVLIAFALSLAGDRLYLPVLGGLGDEPLSLFFLALPVVATVGVGRWVQRSVGALSAAGLVAIVVTQVVSYVVWIGWIVVVCGLQDNRCFD